MALRFFLAVLGFTSGFVACLAARGYWKPVAPRVNAVAPNPVSQAPAPYPADPLDEAQAGPIDALRQEARELRRRTGRMTGEEILARIEELRGVGEKLIQAKDGPKLLLLIRELAALGPDAYAAALDIARRFGDPPPGTDRVFGISTAWFREHGFAGSASPMLRWAVEMPDLAPPWFRHLAAATLARKAGWWPERKDWLVRSLRVEDDDTLSLVLADRLSDLVEPDDLETLFDVAGRADGPGGRRGSARALGNLPEASARRSLEALALTGDPGVQEEAKRWLNAEPPPARVVSVAPLSKSERFGLRPGDLIVSVYGQPVRNARAVGEMPADWSDRLRKKEVSVADETIEVIRDGRRVTLRSVKLDSPWSFDSRSRQPWGLLTRPEPEVP